MTQELSRGANCPIPSPTVRVSVACASPVDVSALLLAADGKVRSDADLIFYNQPSGPGVTYLDATASSGATAVEIDTTELPVDVDKVVITASLDGSGAATFGSAGSLTMTVTDAAGAPAITAPATGLTSEAALVVGEVYRRNGEWKVRCVMQGYENGLAGISTEFGVDVEDDTSAQVSTPPANASPSAPPPPTASTSVAGAASAPQVTPPKVEAMPPSPPAMNVPADTLRLPPINLDKGRVSLEKKQTVSLVKTGAAPLSHVTMGLGWDPAQAGRRIDLDASVIAFDAAGKDVDKVWFMSKQGCRGAIRHSGDNLTGQGDGDDEQIRVDLGALPPTVTALVFTVNSFSGQKFTDVRAAYCRLLDSNGSELVRFSLTDSQAQTGVIMCVMRRSAGGTWSMTAIGEFQKGKTVRAMVPPARDWLRSNPG